MEANKNTKKSWLVYLSMVNISTNFEDKISRGSGENRSGSRAASVAGTGGTLYIIFRMTATNDLELGPVLPQNCIDHSGD